MRCYGFAPLRLPPDLDFASLFHGIDERVPVDALRFGTRVLDRFLRGRWLMDLTGKAALVTGGASGIGAAAVRRLAAARRAWSRSPTGTRRRRGALAEEVGGLALPGDVTDPDAHARRTSRRAEDASAGWTSCCSTPG